LITHAKKGKIKISKKTNERTREKEQFDKEGNFVCPTCKKSLNGIKTDVSESIITLDKHTTQKHKIQCCSEECTAKFFEKQLQGYEE
jgi:hypothetical protein